MEAWLQMGKAALRALDIDFGMQAIFVLYSPLKYSMILYYTSMCYFML